jgi:hypothetical protein
VACVLRRVLNMQRAAGPSNLKRPAAAEWALDILFLVQAGRTREHTRRRAARAPPQRCAPTLAKNKHLKLCIIQQGAVIKRGLMQHSAFSSLTAAHRKFCTFPRAVQNSHNRRYELKSDVGWVCDAPRNARINLHGQRGWKYALCSFLIFRE